MKIILVATFMEHLEGRFAQKNTSCPAGTVARKVRKTGDPSKSAPPINAQTWAVKKDYTQGLCCINGTFLGYIYLYSSVSEISYKENAIPCESKSYTLRLFTSIKLCDKKYGSHYYF